METHNGHPTRATSWRRTNGRQLRLLSSLAVVASGLVPEITVQGFDAAKVLAFSLGPVTVRPHTVFSEVYNDNVFYLPDNLNPIDDFITMFGAGASFSIGREVTVNPWMDFFEEEANFITVDYNWVHLDYLDTSYLDADNHTVALRNRFRGNRLAVKGNDRLAMITGLVGGGTTYRQKVEQLQINDNYLVEYNLSEKTRFYLNGSHNTSDYEKATPFYDITTWRATTGFGHRPFSRTSVFGEFHYGQSLPDPNTEGMVKGPSMDFFGGYLGLQGRFTERLSGMIKGGYEVRSYSDGTDAEDSPIMEVSLSHRFRNNTATTLSYSRQESLSAEYAGVLTTLDALRLRVDQRFGGNGRFMASATGSLNWSDYGDTPGLEGRKDASYQINLELIYMIKVWMLAGFGYEFEMFDSTTQGIIDYDVNRVTLRMVIGY
ncbi:MAG TPA: outer membrane beta-barrel protein [Candidatus Paceibacterota bacterium]|nr:outer membrane beta-barrel protein [Verrucomicrobiota bacterium]HRY48087.1 outer membrane beta-barrel protein [Candidatus Paceibacterota bacterium]